MEIPLVVQEKIHFLKFQWNSWSPRARSVLTKESKVMQLRKGPTSKCCKTNFSVLATEEKIVNSALWNSVQYCIYIGLKIYMLLKCERKIVFIVLFRYRLRTFSFPLRTIHWEQIPAMKHKRKLSLSYLCLSLM